jgi:hypothetical protein
MSDPSAILYPAFAMFALLVGVLIRMQIVRFGAVGRGEMDGRYYRTYQGGAEPKHMAVVTRHFSNLLELPTLFYVVLILTYVTHQVSLWQVACAWAYVALRYAHSYVHLTSNNVIVRFRFFIASCVVLVAMWVGLLWGLIAAR